MYQRNIMKPEESLDIIGRMISDTRRSVLEQSYVPFLTWGATTVAVALLVYLLKTVAGNENCYFYWFLIPVIGIPLTKMFSPRSKLIKTGISTSLRSIWWMLSVLLITFSVASFFFQINTLFFILLLLSIGSFVSGAVIGYPFLKYSSMPGFITCVIMCFITGTDQIPVFAAAIAVMMIVPGFKMRHDLKSL